MWVRFATYGIISLILWGCNYRTLAYRYADWLLLRKIDNYFDLTSEQREYLKPKIQSHLVAINRQLFPKIIHHLGGLERKLDGPLSREDVAFAFRMYAELRSDLLRITGPSIAEFLNTLSSEQHQEFKDELADSNESHEELLALPEAKMQEKYAQKNIERMEDWVGDLTSDQQVRLKKIFAPSKEELQNRFLIRKAFQQTIRDFIGAKVPVSERVPTIFRWAMAPFSMLPQPLMEAYAQNAQATEQRWFEAAQLLNHKQRQHLRAKMRKLIEDLRELQKNQQV